MFTISEEEAVLRPVSAVGKIRKMGGQPLLVTAEVVIIQ